MRGRNSHSGPDPHQNGPRRGDANELRDLLTAKDVARILAITPEALAQLRWRREGPPQSRSVEMSATTRPTSRPTLMSAGVPDAGVSVTAEMTTNTILASDDQ